MNHFVEIDHKHKPEIGQEYIFLMDWYEDIPDSQFDERQVIFTYDGNMRNFTHYMKTKPPHKKRR